jgi:hypothetical protein
MPRSSSVEAKSNAPSMQLADSADSTSGARRTCWKSLKYESVMLLYFVLSVCSAM